MLYNGFHISRYKNITQNHNSSSFYLFFHGALFSLNSTLKVLRSLSFLRRSYCISMEHVDFKAISIFCILNVEMARNWNPQYSVFIYWYAHTFNNSKRKFSAISGIIKSPLFSSMAIILCENHWNAHWLTFSWVFWNLKQMLETIALLETEKSTQLSPRGKNVTSKMNVQNGEDVLAETAWTGF